MSTTPVTVSSRKVLFSTICRARAGAPHFALRARAIENSGVPPIAEQIRKCRDDQKNRERQPDAGQRIDGALPIWPMYMRSTTLARTLTMRSTIGMASRRILPETLPFEKSLTACMTPSPSNPFCFSVYAFWKGL